MRERTLAAALGAASDGVEPSGGPADPVVARPDFGQPRHAARRPRRAWQHPLVLAAAAVVVVALAVGGGVRLASDSSPSGVEVALAGTEEAPGATATVHLQDEPAGVAVVLEIDGLPPAPDGTFYEAWLVGEPGKVSAGTFHVRGEQADITLWLGVDFAAYDAITVTRQPTAGGTTAEGVVVLRGELPRD